ncbi:DUF3592 domain-containing protein [Micromonospora sp. NBC_00858]|uniref:DUF3592 domain-containing protein n=1 Tax=Micromonospora sp. NBC_00858 TaxID=2975979 RepID=UPI003864E1BE|nr:hypothetical protein OG990_28935 [Micromonospora sp. NBC_00858]
MSRVIMLLRRPVWVTIGCVLLAVAGGALLWLPIRTQSALDDWKTELRVRGVPAQAVIYDRVTKRGGTSTTMYLRYEMAGRTYEREVGCFEVCRSAGDEVLIWVNPGDPNDFVTDFDALSGHRGRTQGVVGAAGFVILVVAVPLLLSRIPFRKWFPPREQPRRSGFPSRGGGFTGRSKHKRVGRR